MLVQFPQKAGQRRLEMAKPGLGVRRSLVSVTFLITEMKWLVDENRREKRIELGSQFEGTVSPSGEGVVTRSWGSHSHESTDQNRAECSRSPHLLLLLFLFLFSPRPQCRQCLGRLLPVIISENTPQLPPEACFLDTPQSSQVDNRD